MSSLTVNNINGVNVQSLANQVARAWVNFNGTGTIAIKRSFGVASLTDNGVGNYAVNFTTALPSADYAMSGFAFATAVSSVAWVGSYIGMVKGTTQAGISPVQTTGASGAPISAFDSPDVSAIFFV